MRRKQTALPDVGLDVPAELRDPGHGLWHNRARYRAYMSAHRWTMPARERLNVASSASSRRRHAAAGWALDNGIGRDWHRLRSWGLCD